ncbi:MAG TPA: hypothetical protein VGG48_03645 [Rhizomicrobium sp.]|jgi:hypothetical protein
MRCLLFAGAMLLAAPCAAQDAPPVRFSPIPQVSLAVPKGWMACVEVSGTKVVNGADQAAVDTKPCAADASAAGHAFMADLNLGQTALVLALAFPQPELTSKSFNALTPDVIPRLVQTVCQKTALLIQFAPDGCDAVLGPVSGNAGLLGRATGILDSTHAPVVVRFAYFSYGVGAMLLFLAGGPSTVPEGASNEIFDSITVQ